MEMEILHSVYGDKKRRIDTATEAGRQEAAVLLNRLMAQGAAVILQRGKKAYKVKGYDPVSDLLTVQVGPTKQVTTSGRRSKTTVVAPSAGG